MAQSNQTMLAVLLVVGLVIGAGAGYMLAPKGGETIVEVPVEVPVEVHPLAGKTIEIGITAAQTEDLETYIPAYDVMAERDINEFMDALGLDITIDFLIEDCQATASIALEKTQTFKAMGINLFIGHGWSSQAGAALSYVNENDMVMLAASSTSPLYNIADDRLFRTCPNDFIQAPAIAEMWKTWGTKAVLFFYRADAWGDGLYNIMTNELAARGIEELGKIRYAGESVEFSTYLANAETIVQEAIAEYGVDRVGMSLFVFSEGRAMQTQAADYPGLMSIIWMDTEAGGRSIRMLNEAEGLAVQTRHFSSLMGVDETNPDYLAFNEEYLELTEETPSFYMATRYDACYLMTKSILETGSIEAEDIANVLIPMSWKMYGLTGWMSLNEEGDRIGQVFDIWGFLDDAGNEETAYNREKSGTGDLWYQRWGRYTAADIVMNWDDEAIARGGLVRPGADEFP